MIFTLDIRLNPPSGLHFGLLSVALPLVDRELVAIFFIHRGKQPFINLRLFLIGTFVVHWM